MNIGYELDKLGFIQTNLIEIDYSKKELSGFSKKTNTPTDLWIYIKTAKDFVVIYPSLDGSKWKVSWNGNIKNILEKLKKLEYEST